MPSYTMNLAVAGSANPAPWVIPPTWLGLQLPMPGAVLRMTIALIDPDLSAGQTLQVVQGSVANWTLQATNRDGSFPAFSSGDTLAAKLYQGQTQTLIASLSAAWSSPSGYATGALVVSPTSAQTSPLEADGEYALQVWWTSADTTETACVLRAAVQVLPAPGSTTQAVVPYCKLSDLMQYAPWIGQVQARDTDGEGFYTQRLQARQWLDWAVINCYRGRRSAISRRIRSWPSSGAAASAGGGAPGLARRWSPGSRKTSSSSARRSSRCAAIKRSRSSAWPRSA